MNKSRTVNIVGLLLAGLAACRPTHEPPVLRTVEVWVGRDDGRPLADIPVRIDDEPALPTSADGLGRFTLAMSRGRVRIRAACPEGFRPADARLLELRDLPAQPATRVSLACRPAQRSVVLAVYAPGAEGHPVLVDGERVGEVGPDATFHGLFERAPATTVRVSIDPGALLFDAASLDVTLADRDELVLLTPVLRPEPPAAPPAPAKRRAVRTATQEPHIPYAIRRAHG